MANQIRKNSIRIYRKKTPASEVMERNRQIHYRCRLASYHPLCPHIKRFQIAEDKVPWTADLNDYNPEEFTHESVLSASAADADIDPDGYGSENFRFNAIDGKINRRSFCGTYRIQDGRPLNPIGRTGLTGRGLLWRWGPNHAADPIVTRWKRNEKGHVIKLKDKPVLQFVAIQRKDTGDWAIPGGMVDPGENVSQTLIREFKEEATNCLEKQTDVPSEDSVRDFFDDKAIKLEIFKGYVDDLRNTDNAWMETVAINFHDGTGKYLDSFKLEAGDDAGSVQWVDVDKPLELYATHAAFIQRTCEARSAYWASK